MRLINPSCPECGERAIGTGEWVPVTALIEIDPGGEYGHTGRTTLHWNGMLSDQDLAPCFQSGSHEAAPGSVGLVCNNGHQWASAEAESPAEP